MSANQTMTRKLRSFENVVAPTPVFASVAKQPAMGVPSTAKGSRGCFATLAKTVAAVTRF